MTAPSGIGTWTGLSLPGRSGGPYRVSDVLAAGGMAFVLRATDTATGRKVVLKVPKPQLLTDETIAKRFAREIATLTRFDHPHVVRVLDVGDHGGLPFMVMPLLAGGSLRDRGQNAPQPPASLRDWLPAIADALDTIHALGTLHRDVKPDNILFDHTGVPHLTDFGVVKGVGSDGVLAGATQYTTTGGILGTVPYMAPELLQGQRIDGRTDQFALAVTVYEVLTGRVPFDGTNVGAVMMTQLKFHTAKRRPALATVGVSPELAEAVHRGMAFSADDRYVNCRTLAAAILRCLPEALPPSRPPGPQPGSAAAVPTVSGRNGDTVSQSHPARPVTPVAQPKPVPAVPNPSPPAPVIARPVSAPLRPPIVMDAPPVEVRRPEPIQKGRPVDDDYPIAPDELPGRKPRPREKWWVRTSTGTVLGPYSTSKVCQLLDTGKVKEFDQVSWNNRDWATLGTVGEFADWIDRTNAAGSGRGRSGGGKWLWWVVGGAVLALVVLAVVAVIALAR